MDFGVEVLKKEVAGVERTKSCNFRAGSANRLRPLP